MVGFSDWAAMDHPPSSNETSSDSRERSARLPRLRLWMVAVLLLLGLPLADQARSSLVHSPLVHSSLLESAMGRAAEMGGARAILPSLGVMLCSLLLAAGLLARACLGASHERIAALIWGLAAALLLRRVDLWALSSPERLQSAVAGAASSTWGTFPFTALVASWGCLALGWLTYCAVLDAIGATWPSAADIARVLAGLAFTAQLGLWLWALLGYVSGSPEWLPASL